jgi:hypothetical protein
LKQKNRDASPLKRHTILTAERQQRQWQLAAVAKIGFMMATTTT